LLEHRKMDLSCGITLPSYAQAETYVSVFVLPTDIWGFVSIEIMERRRFWTVEYHLKMMFPLVSLFLVSCQCLARVILYWDPDFLSGLDSSFTRRYSVFVSPFTAAISASSAFRSRYCCLSLLQLRFTCLSFIL